MSRNTRFALILFVFVLIVGGFYFFYLRAKYNPTTDFSIPEIDSASAEPQVVERLESLRRNVEANPQSAKTWGALAKSLHVHGFKEQALSCYKKAAGLEPNEFQWPYLAAILLEDTSSKEALVFFEQASKIRLDYSPLLLREAQILLNQGKSDEAELKFRKAREVDPKCWRAYLGLAQIAVSGKRLEEAQEWLRQALEANPRYAEAYSLLATIYRQSNDAEKADTAGLFAARFPQKNPYPDAVYADLVSEGISSYWYRVRGRAHLENGRYAEARKEFEAALKIKAGAESYNNLGAVLERLGQIEEAIQLYEKSIADAPNALAYSNLGAAYGKLARFEDSIEASTNAIALQKNSVDAHFNLGVAYFKMERCDEAVQALTEAVRLKADHARAHYVLAECYFRLGDRKSAVEEIAILRKLDPKLAERFER